MRVNLLLLLFTSCEFFTWALADGLSLEFEWPHQMVFHWSLSDCMSSQVSTTLLRILSDFNNSALSMVSARALISKYSTPCTKPLVIVPSEPVTIGITVTFMFHGIFSSLARSRCLPLFSLSFSFTPWAAGTAKLPIRQVLFFLLTTWEFFFTPALNYVFSQESECDSKSH